jgi:threonine/homoserine/homoserine lactone efflux protein
VAFFLEGAALGFSAAAQPGPLQAYFLAQSARNGAARTLPMAAVPLATDPALIATVLVLLAQVPQGFVRILGIVGGAVVIWLGAGALRAARAAPPAGEGRAPPVGFVRAMFVNILNPNAWLYWSLGAGPRLATAWRESPARAAAFLAGFYALLVCGNAALILLAGRIARSGPGVARALSVASGVVLLGFGGWTLAKALLAA